MVCPQRFDHAGTVEWQSRDDTLRSVAASAKPRLGRPPASDSARTRERILVAARQAFAERGYGEATNRHLAVKAGITTGALYHYYDSKPELFRAVYVDTQRVIYERFDEALASSTTFVGQFEAVLEAAHQLNRHDPSLAQFHRSVRLEVPRYDELRQAMRDSMSTNPDVSVTLAETAARTGEVDQSMIPTLRAVLRLIFVGLVDAVSDDIAVHRRAVDGVKLLIEGRLIRQMD